MFPSQGPDCTDLCDVCWLVMCNYRDQMVAFFFIHGRFPEDHELKKPLES